MFKLSNSSLALGLILAGGMALSSAASASASASASAFSMTELSQGNTPASAEQVKKPAEGKCGEGKCGAAIES